MRTNKAVFLDRDGTLNLPFVREGKAFPPPTLESFRLFSDAAPACRQLASAGYLLVVVTNQPDVGRGAQSQAVVEAMHARLRAQIPEIARIEVCYDPGQGEPSRRYKPAPGMLLDAAEQLDLDLSRSWMIGDRWRDVDCGQRAGVRTVFIDFGYHEALRVRPDFVARSFGEAAEIVLTHSPSRTSLPCAPSFPI